VHGYDAAVALPVARQYPCTAGYYCTSYTGGTLQVLCPAGYFCVAGASGTPGGASGVPSGTGVSPCGSNTYSLGGATATTSAACVTCASGTGSTPGSSSCTLVTLASWVGSSTAVATGFGGATCPASPTTFASQCGTPTSSLTGLSPTPLSYATYATITHVTTPGAGTFQFATGTTALLPAAPPTAFTAATGSYIAFCSPTVYVAGNIAFSNPVVTVNAKFVTANPPLGAYFAQYTSLTTPAQSGGTPAPTVAWSTLVSPVPSALTLSTASLKFQAPAGTFDSKTGQVCVAIGATSLASANWFIDTAGVLFQATAACTTNGYYLTSPTCSPCNAGTYAVAPATACTPCAAGFYGTGGGLGTPTCTGPCPAGYYCPQNTNSATPTATKCVAGYCVVEPTAHIVSGIATNIVTAPTIGLLVAGTPLYFKASGSVLSITGTGCPVDASTLVSTPTYACAPGSNTFQISPSATSCGTICSVTVTTLGSLTVAASVSVTAVSTTLHTMTAPVGTLAAGTRLLFTPYASSLTLSGGGTVACPANAAALAGAALYAAAPAANAFRVSTFHTAVPVTGVTNGVVSAVVGTLLTGQVLFFTAPAPTALTGSGTVAAAACPTDAPSLAATVVFALAPAVNSFLITTISTGITPATFAAANTITAAVGTLTAFQRVVFSVGTGSFTFPAATPTGGGGTPACPATAAAFGSTALYATKPAAGSFQVTTRSAPVAVTAISTATGYLTAAVGTLTVGAPLNFVAGTAVLTIGGCTGITNAATLASVGAFVCGTPTATTFQIGLQAACTNICTFSAATVGTLAVTPSCMFSGYAVGSMTVTPACLLTATTLAALSVTPACNMVSSLSGIPTVAIGGAVTATMNACPAGSYCTYGATTATGQCLAGYYCPAATGSVQFTGSISGTALTVTGTPTGTIALSSLIDYSIGAVLPDTIVVAQTSGTAGGAGTYTVSVSQAVASTTLYTAGLACAVGTFAGAGSQAVCLPCTSTGSCLALGSNSASSNPCQAGFYCTSYTGGTAQIQCPAGFWCGAGRARVASTPAPRAAAWALAARGPPRTSARRATFAARYPPPPCRAPAPRATGAARASPWAPPTRAPLARSRRGAPRT